MLTDIINDAPKSNGTAKKAAQPAAAAEPAKEKDYLSVCHH
jgi:hypothetical protein